MFPVNPKQTIIRYVEEVKAAHQMDEAHIIQRNLSIVEVAWMTPEEG